MSNIKKSQRWPDKCDVIVLAYDLVAEVESRIKISYGYSREKYEKHIRSMLRFLSKEEPQRKEIEERLIRAEEEYNLGFLRRERVILSSLSRKVLYYCSDANSTYPIYYKEFVDRRRLWNRAMHVCNDIQLELNICARILPSDKGNYMELVGKYGKLFSMIRATRQANNALLKKCKDYDVNNGLPLISANSPSANFCNANNNGNANNNNASNENGVRP